MPNCLMHGRIRTVLKPFAWLLLAIVPVACVSDPSAETRSGNAANLATPPAGAAETADAAGNDETSAHPPFGDGVIDFDRVVPRLARENLPHDWWTIDLCFYPDAWAVTARCKAAIDELNRKYG